MERLERYGTEILSPNVVSHLIVISQYAIEMPYWCSQLIGFNSVNWLFHCFKSQKRMCCAQSIPPKWSFVVKNIMITFLLLFYLQYHINIFYHILWKMALRQPRIKTCLSARHCTEYKTKRHSICIIHIIMVCKTRQNDKGLLHGLT